MSKFGAKSRLPLGSAGYVEVDLDIHDLEHLLDRDRAFVLAVIEKLTAYASVLVTLEPETPAVLRGVEMQARAGMRP